MKLKLLGLLFLSIGMANAQDSDGAFEIKRNHTEKFSISREQEDNIRRETLSNVAQLRERGIITTNTIAQRGGSHVLLEWPLITTDPRFSETWVISDYVDNNSSSPDSSDYNCSNQTFDGNQYTKMYLHPFPLYQMENNITQIVAAADGVIIFKDVLQPGTSCGDTPGTYNNIISVQHNDGTIAWYIGIKNGTSTSKVVGDSVTTSEFLGYVGNSGGTHPHLFFRLWDTDGVTTLDPFFGTCNTTEVDSWWIQQPAYVNSKVNAVFTHFANQDDSTCPEITNFRDVFENETVKMIGYFTNAVAGTSLNFQLQRPDGSLILQSNYTWTTSLEHAYWRVTKTAATFDVSGTWVARFTYNGTTFEHAFQYTIPSAGVTSNEKLNLIKLSPNPTSGIIFIESEININHITLFDMSGRVISEMKQNDIKILDISNLSKRVYFVELESIEGKIVKKIIKE